MGEKERERGRTRVGGRRKAIITGDNEHLSPREDSSSSDSGGDLIPVMSLVTSLFFSTNYYSLLY